GTLDAVDALTDLRVGLNIVDLRQARRRLAKPVRERIEAVLDALAAFYRRRIAEPGSAPPPRLLEAVDAALSAVAASTGKAGRDDALLGLIGIRRGLFPDGPPYVPPARPARADAA